MANDIVQIDREQFEQLIEELKECIEENRQLTLANEFLNEQIIEYNEKFAKDNND